MPLPTPAVRSMNTRWPCDTNAATPLGVSATRFSSALISFGTPMRMRGTIRERWKAVIRRRAPAATEDRAPPRRSKGGLIRSRCSGYSAKMAQIIDGKAVAAAVRAEVRAEVEAFRARFGRGPGLATVLVGDDPASATYVRNKRKACAECGIESIAHELPAHTAPNALLELVRTLNAYAAADGILVQLPLPHGHDAGRVIDAIDPAKDVDGLHPVNQGRLVGGYPGLR